jgi:hypothetical protein
MAKQPTTGQKKSKADIAKAASQKKSGARKVQTGFNSEMDQGKDQRQV